MIANLNSPTTIDLTRRFPILKISKKTLMLDDPTNQNAVHALNVLIKEYENTIKSFDDLITNEMGHRRLEIHFFNELTSNFPPTEDDINAHQAAMDNSDRRIEAIRDDIQAIRAKIGKLQQLSTLTTLTQRRRRRSRQSRFRKSRK